MNLSSNTKLLQPLQTELAQYRGKRAFFEILEGNNGDKLIEMGGASLLKSIGAKLVSQPHDADVIVINGGAGLTDIWSHGFQKLKNYNQQFPKIPLIILPSSFLFKKTNFPALFDGRIAPAFIYARELYSLNILNDLTFPETIRLGIDQDMAFFLQNSTYLKRLQSYKAQKHILIVERDDPESVTEVSSSYQPSNSNSLKKYIPWSIKRPINRYFFWPLKRMRLSNSLHTLNAHTAFTQEWQQRILNDFPDLEHLPVVAADISNPALCSFEKFNRLIAEAAIVVTTRLHVGILAAMLGKVTYLKSGSYHKIRGIFEYSLSSQSNTHLVE